MKNLHKRGNVFLLVVILLLLGNILTGNTDHMAQNKTNLPDEYKPFMYYNYKTGQIFAMGYDFFTYGMDSTVHTVNINKGENRLYFVLFDMSIDFKITKYEENDKRYSDIQF
jgi:hypothetical protein